MREIYLVARGSSKAIVEDKEVALQAGDVLMVEPGEVHTFVDSSPDFMQFVVQSPFIVNDKFKV
jgi:mannose-6-phosphate isomerase-like protein (cupin superfamily)